MALLPIRHPQRDFFVLDIANVVPKDDTASMEHPLFSLATKPDMRFLRYEDSKGNVLEIEPSGKGLPTIFDKDILIFCISQLMHAKNQGKQISNRVRFSAREMLVATNRRTDGDAYELLEKSFSRLRGTNFKTTIRTGGKREGRVFGLIDEGGFVFHDDDRLRRNYCEIILSDWIMRAIESAEVVTISNDYFRLRRPLERRLYEIARKHCGSQSRWNISLEKLQAKTGSNAPLKKFRMNLRDIIEQDHTPFYRFELDKNDLVIVRPRKAPKPIGVYDLVVHQKTHDKARKFAGGWDTAVLEQKWREWLLDRDFIPDSVEGSFIAFIKKHVETVGKA